MYFNVYVCSWQTERGEIPSCLVTAIHLMQPFSIFLPWRSPWNNFQVSGNRCIKIIISTAHGTLTWPVSCRCNNPIIIVNALLSREWYFSVDLFILANKFKKYNIKTNHNMTVRYHSRNQSEFPVNHDMTVRYHSRNQSEFPVTPIWSIGHPPHTATELCSSLPPSPRSSSDL
jgi:hypothetical protein